MTKPADLARAARSLSPEDVARLPGAMRRAITDDPVRDAWAAAKAERDAAIAALYEDVEETQVDVRGNEYVTVTRVYRDPETGPAQEAAIRERWAARKAQLIAEAEG